MKYIFRAFFKTVRFIVGPILLLGERLNTSKGVVRTPEAQQIVDRKCQALALYQFKTCPFCMKVRRALRKHSLNIEIRDAQHDEKNRADLLQGGGQLKVPCLRITDAQGNSEWLYESNMVIQYLHQRFD